MSHPLTLLTPSVDFPVTICVVCYGPHTALAERFLASLYHHTDPALFTLRAGLNEVVPATSALFDDYAARYGNVELYVEQTNIFKAPLMRRMFTETPLTSKWVIWFDDDSYVTQPDWLMRLALKMQAQPNITQWGQTYALWRTDEAMREFISQGRWYRDLPLMRGVDMDGNEAYEFRFATGGFWAMLTDAIRQLDWPEERIIQANDDFLLGEALRQNGHEIGFYEYGIAINAADRRNAEAAEVMQLVL
jgi:GT2 family glycosyltransferase